MTGNPPVPRPLAVAEDLTVHDRRCPTAACLCDPNEDCMECSCACDLITQVTADERRNAALRVKTRLEESLKEQGRLPSVSAIVDAAGGPGWPAGGTRAFPGGTFGPGVEGITDDEVTEFLKTI